MFALRSNQVVEISDYQNAVYVSSNEAAWRIRIRISDSRERSSSSATCCPSGECLASLLY